jgi:hypothetical protein
VLLLIKLSREFVRFILNKTNTIENKDKKNRDTEKNLFLLEKLLSIINKSIYY